MSWGRWLPVCCCLAQSACMGTVLAHSPTRCEKPSAVGAEVFCDGAPVAVVRCLRPQHQSCKALVVDFKTGDRAVLHMPGDFDLDHPESYTPTSKGSLLSWASYAVLAPDGTSIWFKEGFFNPSWHEFRLGDGVLRDWGDGRAWEVLHFDYGDRGIHLWELAQPQSGQTSARRP